MSTGKTTMHQAHRAEPARPAAPAPDADRPPQPGGRRRCARPGGLWRQERGDVPGWVLVTLMTAGLVVALWTVAGSTLTQVFLDAIAKVTGAI